MKTFRKIIIWLFEKYAFDYWVDKQNREEKQKIMREYNLKTEEEFMNWHLEKTREPQREAYEAGRADGYEKAMEARGGNIY